MTKAILSPVETRAFLTAGDLNKLLLEAERSKLKGTLTSTTVGDKAVIEVRGKLVPMFVVLELLGNL